LLGKSRPPHENFEVMTVHIVHVYSDVCVCAFLVCICMCASLVYVYV
jgi:hypothetical protein